MNSIKTKQFIKGTGAIWFFLFMVVGCSDSRETIEKKLDMFLQDDLRMIVAQQLHEVDSIHVAHEPYYRVDELQFFQGDTANLYAAYAKVSFYFYEDIKLKEIRKYRFNTQYHYWDRYDKKLGHFGQ